jgi:AraC-like DNA-binding protein
MQYNHSFTVHRGIKRRATGIGTHAHEESQLTFAASGMVQVHTQEGRWLVPPQLAIWIPAGVQHRLELLTDAELWMVHWEPSAKTSWAPLTLQERAFALRVTPLLRTLLGAAFEDDTVPQKAELIGQLILHELTETAHAPTYLPMPTNPAGRRTADLALADHQNRLDLNALASRAATSACTVSRLFPRETGLSFKAWRQRARIVHAMHQLGRGESIGKVSAACGFASTAAFSFAFRQVTHMTPTLFQTGVGDGFSR